jgi:putative transferase (TIGR04331 family)
LVANTKRYLITTANEKTWKFDRPILFLGEWCRLYERKHIWQNMDAIVVKPYGTGKSQKDIDYTEARTLESELFPIFCNILNKHHDTQHDVKFWKVLLGHWFARYVDVMFNRIKTLEYCLNAYELSGTTVISDNYLLAPIDSYAAIWAFNDDEWNNVLYARILIMLGLKSNLVDTIAGNKSDSFQLDPTLFKIPFKKRVLKWGYQRLGEFLGFWARDNDALIINSYLPKKEQIELELALGQVPQLRTSSQFKISQKTDYALRQTLCNQLNNNSNYSLSNILYSMVFELLPVCYLEGFEELSQVVEKLAWPIKPKFILTSNNFDTDEIFKFWTATKVASGTKYIVGQHGNNYGTYRYMHPSNEEITSDKFLTWGWKDGLPQHTQTFILKTVGSKAKMYDKSGGLLLIELCLNLPITCWDGYYEFLTYFEDQKSFVDKLATKARKKMTIRLHSAHHDLKWNEESRWREFDNNIKLDTGQLTINQLIKKSRLVIHSYDSTGILETLSQNIPTLAFWQNGLDHLRDSALPFYQLLVDVGIIHLNVESVANKVNTIWDDVDAWWYSSSVQNARKVFCERYARVSQKPVSELKSILMDNCH